MQIVTKYINLRDAPWWDRLPPHSTIVRSWKEGEKVVSTAKRTVMGATHYFCTPYSPTNQGETLRRSGTKTAMFSKSGQTQT